MNTYSMVVPTIHGPMIVLRTDTNQFAALSKTGVSLDENVIQALAKLLAIRPEGGKVFLDIGACFGTYTLGLARHCALVYAYEPQRILFNCIAGTVALNGLENVRVSNVAVGSRRCAIDVPRFDYSREMNFGSVEFGGEQTEQLAQERRLSIEPVNCECIDGYKLPRVDLVKIDVEGMEEQVLDGMRDTIRRCRPVMFIEHGKSNKFALQYKLESMGYKVRDVGGDFLCLSEADSLKVDIEDV